MNNEASKLKPFDLEKALKGEKVVTRNGTEVTDVRHFPTAGQECTVAGVVLGDIESFTETGAYFSDYSLSSMDLFMAPKERVVWVNIYMRFGSKTTCGYFYDYKEDADRHADSSRIGNRAY